MKKKAFRAALPYSLPICIGFLFIAMSYGFLMRSRGFSVFYPMAMSAFIFAGSMEFVAVELLLSAYAPLHAFLLTLMVNARHLFYGISMLEKYKGMGWKKPYLIFGMCDETFSINCTVTPPEGVDRGWFMFFVTLLNQTYWVAGATLGALLGFSTTNGEAFGIFAGTAINDTSSVTAAASTWDSLYGLGSQTLDKAVTVKLTRTLAIIPITLVLAFVRTKRAKTDGTKVNFKKIFPMFILYFLLASVITTICVSAGVSASVFAPLKTLSKFLIVMAMCAVGLNTNIVKLVKTGGKPLIMGFCCWVAIACVSIAMQHLLGFL